MGRTSDARERLITSTRELLPLTGYNGVGVSEICAKADVRKGSFYYFFDSKQMLASEAIAAHWSEEREQWKVALNSNPSPLRALEALCRVMEKSVSAGRRQAGSVTGCTLGNLALEVGATDPVLRARLKEVFDEQVGLLVEVLLRNEDEVRSDVPPTDLAREVIALIEGMILFAKLQDDPKALKGLWPAVARAVTPCTKG